MSETPIQFDFSDLGLGRDKEDHYYYRLLRRHFDLRLCDQPRYLLYSHAGQRHRLHAGLKIYWTAEAYSPDYRECDFSITHQPDSDRNLRAPVYSRWMDPALLVKKPGEEDEILAHKRRFCAFFTSYVSPRIAHRLRFFEKLSEYRRVDSAGKAMNNIGRMVPYGLQAKIDFLRGYKFYMAFENESMPGYTTEKIAEAMLARCIPIYWGNPEVAKEFNPRSFLNYHDFESEEALIDRIIEIDRNDDLYRQYLSEPFFHDNTPNKYFDEERTRAFFERVFNYEGTPVAAKRARSFFFGRWTVAKGDQSPTIEIISRERRQVSIDFADYGPCREKHAIHLYRKLSERFDLRLCDNPDYLIYSHAGDMHKLFSGTKIFWTNEADAPDWSQTDYALTHRYSDNPRHLRYPFYAEWVPAEALIKQPGEEEEILRQKTEFCAILSTYDNRKTRHRFRFFEKLNTYRKVDSAGRARNNIGRQIPFEVYAKREFLRPYKFNIAFENKRVPGYVTEKIAEAMEARCIPIYYGCPRVAEEFNPRSFLNYHDFESEEALIERIREIDQDEELYLQYLREPFFHNNTPNACYDEERFFAFFEKVFSTSPEELPRKRRHPLLGRWRMVRRNRPPTSQR